MNARVQPVAIVEAKTTPIATHEVRNQARPPLGFNAFDGDRALSSLIAKIAPWAKDKLSALGLNLGMTFEPDLLEAPKDDNSALVMAR